MQPLNIYLAGKINAGDWRHAIVRGLRSAQSSLEPLRVTRLLHESIFGTHSYVGPYFISCDHGCYHGDTKHGVYATDNVDNMSWCSGDDLDQLTRLAVRAWGDERHCNSSNRDIVKSLCVSQIEDASLVIAYINAPDAYGSLVELGYAHALKIPIWVMFGPDAPVKDMWFAAECAEQWWVGVSDPCEHLRPLLTPKPVSLKDMPYQDYLKTEHWQGVRKAALERAGDACQLCNRTGQLHTHHRTYERRGAELDTDVIVLCKSCHERFHAVTNGRALVTVK